MRLSRYRERSKLKVAPSHQRTFQALPGISRSTANDASVQPTCSHDSVRRCFWLPDRVQRLLWSQRFTAGCHPLQLGVPGSNPGDLFPSSSR
jgi:hypothetical protein